MSNVRFYRLTKLPEYVKATHEGIFVHLTTEYSYSGRTYKAGLWFGGANGWEYLTNDTTPESITNAINNLNAGGFTQATIGANTTEGSESATGSTLKILGIKEVKGKIEQDNTNDVNIAIDGVYNESSNKIATQSTVTNAINGLNVEGPIQAVTFNTSENGNTTLTFNGVKEENGLIAQGNGTGTFTVGDAKLKIQIGSSTATDVFSANAQEDRTIQLNGNVFKKDGDVISVITKNNDVSSTNPLVTQNDIDSLAGAMHYKGAISVIADSNTPQNWPTTVAAGDVYIATGNFEKDGNVIESGDLIVFNSENLTDYKVIQSNITLGTKNAQIAKNDGDLTDGNIVVATTNGIRTSNINGNVLNEENNTRNLTITNNGPLHHSVAITDSLKIMSREFNKTINISSVNSSIEIVKNPTEGTTGVMLDLVWNESI